MRYILLDKITEVVPGKSARGVKCVTLTDEVLHDHFPDYPILPGALLVEAATQLAGFLLEVSAAQRTAGTGAEEGSRDQPRRALLVQIDRAKFRRPARPGDTVEIVARLASALESAAQVEVEATIDGDNAMRGKLTFMLKEVPSALLHEQRRYLYRLWTRDLEPEVIIP